MKIFIERREENGDFAIRRPGSTRASGTGPTQRAAAELGREMYPDATIFLERVRNTKAGRRDKWRIYDAQIKLMSRCEYSGEVISDNAP